MPLIFIPETEEEKEELDRDFDRYVQVSEEDIKEYNEEWLRERKEEKNCKQKAEKGR